MNFCDTRQACPKSETIWWQEGSHELRSLGDHAIAQVLFAASVIAESIFTSKILAAQCMYHIEKSVMLCSFCEPRKVTFPIILDHFFIILWLVTMSSPLPLSSERISPWRIFLAISFCDSFSSCPFPCYFLVVFFLFLIWTIKIEGAVLHRH